MRGWVLPLALVSALFLAVPASASHHPPNAVAGDVSMTLSRQGAKLTMSYTVDPPKCERSGGCELNWDKPNRIDRRNPIRAKSSESLLTNEHMF
jgi:hypothetical protein